jgi:hypothetical protein
MEHSFLSHADAAQRNRNNILHFIKKHQPLSRTDIWEALDISRASVTQVIRQLQESSLITETGLGESSGGRKPQYLMFNGAGKKFFAFDWMTQQLSLLDLDGQLLYETHIPLERPLQPTSFGMALSAQVQAIAAQHLCPTEDIIGLCLAMPGLVDSRKGRVIYSVELGWQDVPIGSLLQQMLDMDVFVERTANIMALGCQALEDIKQATHLQLFLLGSDGIGVCSVFHGNCQHGANYMHGELGHIKTGEDVLCSCGQTGCLEAVIHDRMLRSGGHLSAEILELLSIGIAASINISDVSCAMLVGSYINQMTLTQQEYLTNAIRSKVTGQHLRHLELHFSENTKDLALSGMCAYAFDRYFPLD